MHLRAANLSPGTIQPYEEAALQFDAGHEANEHAADAGVRHGLAPDKAAEMVVQTFAGTAALLRARGCVRVFIEGGGVTVSRFLEGNLPDRLAGEVVETVPRRRIEVRAGEVSKGRTERHDAAMKVAGRVAERLDGLRGPMNVQIFCDGEDVNVIEINPRFGGGYPLSHHAGAHMARWMLEEHFGLPCTAGDESWEDGVVMLRYDEAVFARREAAGVDRFGAPAPASGARSPGRPRQTGQTLVLGGSPNAVEQPQNILLFVDSSTCTSSPSTGSKRSTTSAKSTSVGALIERPPGWAPAGSAGPVNRRSRRRRSAGACSQPIRRSRTATLLPYSTGANASTGTFLSLPNRLEFSAAWART